MKGKGTYPQDFHKSFYWFNRSRLQGHVVGTTYTGLMLLRGVGVAKDERQGKLYLGLAVGKGSDYAAYLVGSVFADGTDGLEADTAEASHWLEQAVHGQYMSTNMGKTNRQSALQKLNETGKS